MPDSSSTSFIPKKSPAQNEKRIGKRKVYIGTLIVRILFFAALAGSAGVYLYGQKLQSNLEDKVSSLNTAIEKFDEEKMDEVLSFNARLSLVNDRLRHTASIVKLLSALENSTVGSVKINQLSVVRNQDKDFTLEATILTDSFNAALFQREVFNKENELLVVSDIKELTLQTTPPAEEIFLDIDGAGTGDLTVAFVATISIDREKIPHGNNFPEAGIFSQPQSLPAAETSVNIIDEVLSSGPEEVNQEIL